MEKTKLKKKNRNKKAKEAGPLMAWFELGLKYLKFPKAFFAFFFFFSFFFCSSALQMFKCLIL